MKINVVWSMETVAKIKVEGTRIRANSNAINIKQIRIIIFIMSPFSLI